MCRVLHDINLDSSTKSALMGGESPKMTKPQTPNVEEIAQESSKPTSPDGAQNYPSASGSPTSPTRAAPSSNPTGTSSGPKPTESPKTSPMSPWSYGLGTASGYHPGEVSSVPRLEKPSRQYSWSQITQSLSKPSSTMAGSSWRPLTLKQIGQTPKRIIQP
jgi:hypothetical protein